MMTITTAITELAMLLQHPDPALICVTAGAPKNGRWLARVKHSANAPARPADRKWLKERLGRAAGPFDALYSFSDGILLFAPVIPRYNVANDGGFQCVPINDIRENSRELVSQDYLGSPPVDAFLVFAQVPLSGNHICIQGDGQHKGELVELNHDAPAGGYRVPTQVAELLHFVCRMPARMLCQFGCYTRYSDGKSAAQWIPIRYVPNASALSANEIAEEPLPDWWQG